jgi:dihydroflavonol-4-reductase
VSVFVTGSTGLVGAQVCRELLVEGHDVVAMVRHRTPPEGTRPANARLDYLDGLKAAMRGATTVFHCAAVYAYGRAHDAELEAVNVDGTRNVIQAAAEAGVRRVVVTSSSVTVGSSLHRVVRDETRSPDDEFVPAYFASKLRQEQVALQTGAELGVEVVLACPTVILGGPEGRLVPSNAILLRYLLDPTRSTYPGGCNVVSLGDAARGHVLLAERGAPGERYLLGGENVSWRLLHTILAQLAGVPGPYAEVSAAVTVLVAAASELAATVAGTEPLVTRDEALTIGRYYWYDDSLARALGYTSGSARRSVAEGLSWLLASDSMPRWVRESLRVAPEVRVARRLVPRPL